MVATADVETSLLELSSDDLRGLLLTVMSKRLDVKEALLCSWLSHAFTDQTKESSVQRGPPLPDDGKRQRVVTSLSSSKLGQPLACISQSWSTAFMLFFNAILLVTVVSSYLLAAGTGRVSSGDFYISSAFDTGLAHRVGAFGISVACITYMFAMFTRYLAIRKSLIDPFSESVTRRISRLNIVALVSEICSSVGGLGAAAFEHSFLLTVHYSFAFVTFAGAIISIILHSYIDELICYHAVAGHPAPGRRWCLFRLVQCIVSFAGLGGMFISISLVEGADHDLHILISCTSELIMAVSLFSYYATWMTGKGYNIGIEVFLDEKSLRTLSSYEENALATSIDGRLDIGNAQQSQVTSCATPEGESADVTSW